MDNDETQDQIYRGPMLDRVLFSALCAFLGRRDRESTPERNWVILVRLCESVGFFARIVPGATEYHIVREDTYTGVYIRVSTGELSTEFDGTSIPTTREALEYLDSGQLEYQREG